MELCFALLGIQAIPPCARSGSLVSLVKKLLALFPVRGELVLQGQTKLLSETLGRQNWGRHSNVSGLQHTT